MIRIFLYKDDGMAHISNIEVFALDSSIYRLPDWQNVCSWISSLPMAAQFITGGIET